MPELRITENVKPLLSMVGGRTRRSAARASLQEESSPLTSASPSEEPSSPAVQPAEDDSLVNAPPASSTDEESDDVGHSASTRGNITSSLFRPPKPRSRKEQQAGSTANGSTQSAQRPRKSPERASRRLSEIKKESRPKVEDISDDDINAVDEPPKRPAKRGGKPGYGSHLENQVFLRSTVSQKYGTARSMLKPLAPGTVISASQRQITFGELTPEHTSKTISNQQEKG